MGERFLCTCARRPISTASTSSVSRMAQAPRPCSGGDYSAGLSRDGSGVAGGLREADRMEPAPAIGELDGGELDDLAFGEQLGDGVEGALVRSAVLVGR